MVTRSLRLRQDTCTLHAPRRAAQAGFSLLEVMVAIAILGLSLSVILSAQGGLAASNRAGANMGNAANYGRCKMTELEEHLLKFGYPEVDDLQDGQACCDDDSGQFTCDTRVERVVLPNPASQNSAGDGGSLNLGGAGGVASAAASAGLPPGMVNPAGGADINLDGGLQAIGSQLTSQFGGAGGMLNMVLGMVYPAIKPMLEASIRKATVTVHWSEGPRARELVLVQYLTNPQRGGFIAGVPQLPGAAGSAAPATGGPSQGSTLGGGASGSSGGSSSPFGGGGKP